MPPPGTPGLPPTGGGAVPPTGPGMVPYDPGGEPVLLMVGDIAITQTYVILPYGRYPLRGTIWTVQDNTQVNEGIPAWAIVLAIIGFLIVCIFSLFFLLVKERRYTGNIVITVSGPGLYHSVPFPAGPASGARVADLIGRARAYAASAPPAS